MNKKSLITIGLIAILGIAATIALAAGATQDQDDAANQPGEIIDTQPFEAGAEDTAVTTDPGPNFVDEDGDGVCDTCGNEPGTGTGNQYGAQNNNAGSNDPNLYGANNGGNFVDEDGDGVCDTCGASPQGGTGNGYGAGTCIDEDGDGVCDNQGVPARDGTGNQYGRQGQSRGQGGQGQGGRWGQGGQGQGNNAAPAN